MFSGASVSTLVTKASSWRFGVSLRWKVHSFVFFSHQSWKVAHDILAHQDITVVSRLWRFDLRGQNKQLSAGPVLALKQALAHARVSPVSLG